MCRRAFDPFVLVGILVMDAAMQQGHGGWRIAANFLGIIPNKTNSLSLAHDR